MVVVFPKTTVLLFTQIISSRTSFLSTRMICHISPGHHSHQTSLLLNLCGLHGRGKCMVAIHRHHRYLNLSQFCRKNGARFFGKHTGIVFIHFEKTASCFEWQQFFYTMLGKGTCVFRCFHIFGPTHIF